MAILLPLFTQVSYQLVAINAFQTSGAFPQGLTHMVSVVPSPDILLLPRFSLEPEQLSLSLYHNGLIPIPKQVKYSLDL
jgi:hypothetical protein